VSPRSRRTCEPRVRPHEDEDGAGRDEAVDEVLAEPAVDLCRHFRRALTPIAPGVVDVDVEPVLVGRVARAEWAAAPAAQVADPEARRRGMRGRVAGDDAKNRADEDVRPPAPARPVRTPVQERVQVKN
jgi:hypothetical protein